MALENRRRCAERRQPRDRQALTSQEKAELHEHPWILRRAAPAALLRGFW
jgi:hypothetical protein